MNRNIIALFTIVVFVFGSCQNSEFPGFKKTDDGMLYKIHFDNGGKKAIPGDYMTVEMSYKTNEDSLIFDGQGQSFPLQLVPPVFKGDINEALAMMGIGDSATFVIRADSFLLLNAQMTQLPDFVNENSKIIFDIKVHNIQSLQELQAEENARIETAKNSEAQIIATYISEHNINCIPTESGLYFILDKKGNGKKALAGKTVKVHFIGRFLDGTKFDSSYDRNRPNEFVLGRNEAISGIDEAVALMRVGDEATLIIPSSLGYGIGRGQIPPYTPLLFDIKLIDVK